MSYEGVIIDGALPRTEANRVYDLLGEAEALIANFPGDVFKTKWYGEYTRLQVECNDRFNDEDFEFWHEVEDETIGLINDILPDDVVCVLHPDDPGTVVIWDMRYNEEN